MRLSELMPQGTLPPDMPRDPAVVGLAVDSRKVQPCFLFAALAGSRADGASFVTDAVSRGATAILAAPDVALPPIAFGRRQRSSSRSASITRPTKTHLRHSHERTVEQSLFTRKEMIITT